MRLQPLPTLEIKGGYWATFIVRGPFGNKTGKSIPEALDLFAPVYGIDLSNPK